MSLRRVISQKMIQFREVSLAWARGGLALQTALLLAVCLLGLHAAPTFAQTNGTWNPTGFSTGAATGLWSSIANWSGGSGPVADGIDGVADFSQLNITADSTVHLDSARIIGELIFQDSTTASNNWILDNNGFAGDILTLSDSGSGAVAVPTISVLNQTATISAVLAGTQGLTKIGAGTLALRGVDTFSGNLTLSAGILNISSDLNLGAASNGVVITAASTLAAGGNSLVTTGSSRAITINSGVNATFDSGANMLVIGGNITSLNTASATVLTKATNNGILVLSGNNQFGAAGITSTIIYAGNSTTLDGGIIRLASNGALGSFPVVIDAGTANNLGNQSFHATELSGGISLGAGDTITFRGNNIGDSQVRSIFGSNTWAGNVFITSTGGSMNLETADPNGTFTLSGNISTGTSNQTGRSVFLFGNGSGLVSGSITNATGAGAGNISAVIVGGQANSMWTFTGANTYSGGSAFLSFAGGTGVLDYQAGASFASTTNLAVTGGTAIIKGKSSGATTQSFAGNAAASFTVNAGGSNIVINPNGGTSTTITLPNNWARGAAGTVNFDLSAGTATSAVISSNPTVPNNGIFGYATVKDSSGIGFATINASQVARYTGATALTNAATTSTTNYKTNGTLNMTQAGGFAVNSLDLDAGGGGTLDLGGSSNVLTLTSGGLLMTNNSGAGNYTIQNGQVGANNSELILQQFGSGTLTINGSVAGGSPANTTALPSGSTGILTKSGTGTLVLGSQNIYRGVTNLNGGILQISSDNNLGGGSGTIGIAASTVGGTSVTLTSATLPTGFTVGSTLLGRAVTAIAGNTVTLAAGGASTAITNGTASWALEGGALNINGGTLQATTSLSLGESNSVATAPVTLNRNIAFGAMGGTIDTQANTVTIGGVISSTIPSIPTGQTQQLGGTLVKNGSGMLVLSGANTYFGGTIINAGTVQIAADSGLGGFFNGVLTPGTTNPDINIIFGGNSTLQTSANVTLGSSRSVMINNGVTATIDPQANTLSMTGEIWSNSSSGGLAIGTVGGSSSGQVTFGGRNEYTVPTTINTGTLVISSVANGGSTSGLGASSNAASNLVFAGTSALQYTGVTANTDRNFTIADGTTATINVSTAASTLTMSGVTPATTGGLTKAGNGTLVLTGAQVYTGATTVNAGTLQINAPGSLAAGSAVTVNSGATLGGTGTINGLVSIASGATLSPGASVGTLTVGSLSLASGSALTYEFGPGTNDKVNVNTASGLTIGGGAISLFTAGTGNAFTTDGNYTLFNYSGTLNGAANNLTIANAQPGKLYSLNGSTSTAVILTISDAVSGSWTNSGGNELWTVAGNWNGTIPNVQGALATFGTSLSGSDGNVQLNGNKTVGGIVFDNTSTSYNLIAGPSVPGSQLILDNGIANAAVNVNSVPSGGTHTISVPIQLNSAATFTAATGANLTVAGAISGSKGLTISGPGAIILSGNNSYTTTTVNNGGTLSIGGDPTTIGAGGASGTLGSGNVTLGGGVSLVFNRSGSLVVNNNILNGGNVVMNGSGTVTLGGANTFSTLTTNAGITNLTSTNGATLTMNAGTVNLSGTMTSPNLITVGATTTGNSLLQISGGTLNATRNANPSVQIAAVASGSAAVNMSSGSIVSANEFHIGQGSGVAGTEPYAAFTMNGGSLTTGSYLVVGFNNDRAVLNQSNGSIAVNVNVMTIGAGGNGSIGVANLSGGTFTATSTTIGGIYVGENGTGTLNVSGTAAVTAIAATANNGILIGRTAGSNGTVNLLGGTLATSGVAQGLAVGTFNFNGGTLKATASNATFMTGINNVFINQGAIIDDGGNTITIGQLLQAPQGSGVSAAGVVATGTGFIDTPIIQVTGDGTGATAVANLDGSGNLTGITITNPGINYTNESFNILGGGIGSSGSITGGTPVTNVGGGLTKIGAGTLTLTNSGNSYTGQTKISSGVLEATNLSDAGNNSSIGLGNVSNDGSSLLFDGGTLRYTGTSPASTNRNFSISAGKTAIIDVPTVANSLTLRGGETLATNGGLTKVGLGTLIFDATAPTSIYTGATSVSQGTLLVNNTISGTSAVSVAAGAVLGGTGSIAGSVTHTQGTITGGTVGGLGTLTFTGPLALSGGTTRFDEDGNNLTSGDQIHANGILNLSSSSPIDIEFLDLSSVPTSPFTLSLFTYGSLSGSTANLQYTSNAGRSLFTTNTSTAGVIKVNVTPLAAADLVWNSTSSTAWDVGISSNWHNNGTNAQDKFFQNDKVTFADGTGLQPSIVINSSVAPQTVSVTSSSATNYSFSGTGKITGANTTLSKSGSSTLFVKTNNDYGGGTNISGGTVNVGNGTTTGSLGSGDINNNSASLIYQRIDATLAVPNNINGSGSLTYNGGGAATFSGQVSQSTITVSGAGSSATFSNNVNIDSGMTIGSGATGVTISGSLNGNGGITFNGAAAGNSILSGGNGFNGQVVINAGTVFPQNNGAFGANSTFVPDTPLTDNTVVHNGGVVYITTAANNYSENFSLDGQGNLTNSVLRSGGNQTITMNGTVAVTSTSLISSDAGSGFVFNGATALYSSATDNANVTIDGAANGATVPLLTINGDVNLHAGKLTITINGPVNFSPSGTATISSEVAGFALGLTSINFDPASGGTLNMNGNITYAGNLNFTPAANAFVNVAGAISGTGTKNFNPASGAVVTVTGSISNTGAVTINTSDTSANSGVTKLMANNSFNNGINLINGFLVIGANNALGADADLLTIQSPQNAAGIIQGTLQLAPTSGNISVPNPISFWGRQGANFTPTNPGIENVQGNNTLLNNITTVAGGGDWAIQSDAGSSLTVSGNFLSPTVDSSTTRTLHLVGDGNGTFSGTINNGTAATNPAVISVQKNGAGTWTLSNPGNNYSGNTTVDGGTLLLGGPNVIAHTAHVNLNTQGAATVTLATGGFAQNFATAPLVVNGAATLDMGNAASPAVVKFADSNGSFGGLLTIKNWDYTIDHLNFSDATGLSSQQLQSIQFADFQLGASLTTIGTAARPVGEVTPLIGDVNQDGVVNPADITALMTALTNISQYQNLRVGTSPSGVFTAADAKFLLDVNGDGKDTNADIQAEIAVVANFATIGNGGNGGGSGGGSLHAVPEPASFVLLALGGLALLAHRLRRAPIGA